MKNNKAKLLAAVVISAALMTSCGTVPSYDGFEKPVQGESRLHLVDTLTVAQSYEGVAPTVEQTEAVFRSSDGVCVIEKKKSYYDVTIDFEQTDHYHAGYAYGEALRQLDGESIDALESYIFEMINFEFQNLDGDYTEIKKRTNYLMNTLEKEYRDELNGLADAFCMGASGFVRDDKLSRDELFLASLVPDVLRPTSCSSISASGNATASGERLTCRFMEWMLGSSNQICSVHCVLHLKNGEKSITMVSALGMLDLLTGINQNGVMISEYDVGSPYNEPYVYEGKTSYSYALRYAIENYDTAREAGEYLLKNCDKYTFNVNVGITDKNEALCAELVLSEKNGSPILRDCNTPLVKNLAWSDPDYFCIVNSYVADGNADQITRQINNAARWEKYRKMFCGQDNMTIGRFKELLTSEKIDTDIVNIMRTYVVHMVIADYSDHSLQAVFTGTDGITQTPEFISLGRFD